MNNDIYLIGEVGYEITLKNVIDGINKSDKSKPLNVHIHSAGGSVYDGIAIYNYLKNLEQEVNTISSGLVASIASVIFLAGNKETRKINKTDSFLIHLPMGFSGGNAKDLEKTATELRNIEEKLANIYAIETELTKEEATELMAKDAMLDVDFLKTKGFVSEIVEFKAVAKLFNKNDRNEMSENLTKKDAEGLFAKFEKSLKAIFKGNAVNKIVQDANGMDIDFTEVDEDAEVVLGDKAIIEGSPADGSYVMPSGDTFVFVAGELTEIVKEEEEEEEDEALTDLKTENANLKEEIETLKNEKLDIDAKFVGIEKDFTELKNSISSNFENKKRIKKEDSETGSRTLRKK